MIHIKALAIIIGIVIAVGLIVGLTPQATWEYLKSFSEIAIREIFAFLKWAVDAIRSSLADSSSSAAIIIGIGGYPVV